MATPGVRMRNRRVELHLTLDEVAEVVGKSPQYLSALELNKNRPPAWDLLKQLVSLYGVSADYLLGISSAPEVASMDQVNALIGVFGKMSNRRQKDLLAMADTLTRLDANENVDQSSPIDPHLIELYARLKELDRLDLLEDAVAALSSKRDFDNAEFGFKPRFETKT